MTESIRSHQVKTEVEMLFELSADGVGITLVGVVEGNHCIVSLVNAVKRCFACRIGLADRSIHTIRITALGECKVLEEHVVQCLGEHCVESKLPSVKETLLKTEVSPEYLRVLEVSVKSIDGSFSASRSQTSLHDIIVRIAREWECRSWLGNCNGFSLHTCVVVCI